MREMLMILVLSPVAACMEAPAAGQHENALIAESVGWDDRDYVLFSARELAAVRAGCDDAALLKCATVPPPIPPQHGAAIAIGDLDELAWFDSDDEAREALRFEQVPDATVIDVASAHRWTLRGDHWVDAGPVPVPATVMVVPLDLLDDDAQ
jgi:hypothetical protein